MEILLKVSLGEALDKLSILEIKKDRIKGDRLYDVLKEYNYLNSQLEKHKCKLLTHYRNLYMVNLAIWEEQDVLRNLVPSDSPDVYSDLCASIIYKNDQRCAIKKTINTKAKSEFVEQKGYVRRGVIVVGHLGLGDCITMFGALNFLSTLYDDVVSFATDKHMHNVLTLCDNPNIKYYPIISNQFGLIKSSRIDESGQIINYIKQYPTYDVMSASLVHLRLKPYVKITHPYFKLNQYRKSLPGSFVHCVDFINKFYDNIKVPRDVYYKYFSIQIDGPLIQNNKNIVFIHETASDTVKTINVPNVLFGDKYMIVSPCKNYYSPDHPNYGLANLMLNKPLKYYVNFIIHAHLIFIIDSSFACIVLPLYYNKQLMTKNVTMFDRRNTEVPEIDLNNNILRVM